MISFEDVHTHLRYDSNTGLLWWRQSRMGRQIKRPAGTTSVHGYIVLCIDRERHRAHRLIWFMQTRQWPKNEIDHRNGVRNDNRWCNLREATRGQNKANATLHRNNVAGLKGVRWHKQRKKWRAEIKGKYLGLFSTAKEAHAAYVAAAEKHFGEFARA